MRNEIKIEEDKMEWNGKYYDATMIGFYDGEFSLEMWLSLEGEKEDEKIEFTISQHEDSVITKQHIENFDIV